MSGESVGGLGVAEVGIGAVALLGTAAGASCAFVVGHGLQALGSAMERRQAEREAARADMAEWDRVLQDVALRNSRIGVLRRALAESGGAGSADQVRIPPPLVLGSQTITELRQWCTDTDSSLTKAEAGAAQRSAQAIVAGLVVTGVTARSLAVLAAGGDYLLDAAGVGVALLAIRLSARSAGNGPRQGSLNASSVAALINSGWLLALEVLVSAAAIDRLITGTPHVDGLPVLVVSGIAAMAMAGGALVLRGDGDDQEDETGESDLSIAAVLLDTIADAATADHPVCDFQHWLPWRRLVVATVMELARFTGQHHLVSEPSPRQPRRRTGRSAI